MTASSTICCLGGLKPEDTFGVPSGRPGRPAPLNLSPKGALDKPLEDAQGDVNTRMHQIIHIVISVGIFDINVVVVAPAYRPRLVVPEPVAAVLEAIVPADPSGTSHVEGVVVTEMGTVTGIRNTAILAATAVVSNGL